AARPPGGLRRRAAPVGRARAAPRLRRLRPAEGQAPPRLPRRRPVGGLRGVGRAPRDRPRGRRSRARRRHRRAVTVRALWRGVVRIGDARVPVRLYPAVADRSVSFRLLDRRYREPVRRALVHPASGAVVAYEDAQRGYLASTGELVVLGTEELAGLAPEPSRDVTVTRFVPPEAIELRWYDRPFYLGPDEDGEAYHALAAALARVGRVGVARWVMRDREYHGALRLHHGYPVLVALRSADEVLPLERFEAPSDDD